MTAPLRPTEPNVVSVALGTRAYDIAIGRGLLTSLGERIKALRPGARVAIVTDETVAKITAPSAWLAQWTVTAGNGRKHKAIGRVPVRPGVL